MKYWEILNSTAKEIAYSYAYMICLYIHSICEASASCSGINLCSKIPVYPILGFGPEYPPSPQFKFWQDLAL